MLIFELVVIFIGLPLGYRFSPVRIPALPVLWLVAAYAWWQLQRDLGFDRRQLWNAAPLVGQLSSILPLFLLIAAILWAGVHWMTPALEWSFVRQHPVSWAAVMVLYPVLSVCPQGVLYRAFFMHRYAALFPVTSAGQWALIVASALARISELSALCRDRNTVPTPQ